MPEPSSRTDPGPGAVTPEALLASVAIGSRDAFEALYRQTSAKLFGICLRVLPQRAEAEDVLQEVFAAIWQRAAQYDASRGSGMAWLAIIARNRAIDRLRALPTRAHTSPIDLTAELADAQAAPHEDAERTVDRERLDHCLHELDTRRRTLIRAAFFDGSTYEELAARSGSPLGSVKSWIRRGLLQLRACLEQSYAMSANGPISGDEDRLEPPSDEVLAGEYVLGVLDATQRRAAQARIATDPAFARMVVEWEQRLSPLHMGVGPVEVPPHVWQRIRSRLGWTTSAVRGSLWQNVAFWRAATALAVIAAIAAVLVGRVGQHVPQQPSAALQPAAAPVTTLASDSGAPGWLASIDAAHGTMLLVPVPAPPDARGRVPELWLIPPGKAPQPLGLLSSERSHAVTVPARLRSALKSGSLLAVSLEPPGGAPHGVPTGPIVAKGAIQL